MLIRLYDSYHAAAPEKTGIAYSAEGLTDLTGYGAVAVGGARLIYAGESRLAGTPDAETAAALQETITAAGAVPLLHVGGSASALKDDPSHTAAVMRGCFWIWRSSLPPRRRISPRWRRRCGPNWERTGCSI